MHVRIREYLFPKKQKQKDQTNNCPEVMNRKKTVRNKVTQSQENVTPTAIRTLDYQGEPLSRGRTQQQFSPNGPLAPTADRRQLIEQPAAGGARYDPRGRHGRERQHQHVTINTEGLGP